MNAAYLTDRVVDAVADLHGAQGELEQLVKDAAEAEAFYRQCKAKAFTKAVDGANADEREARAEQTVFPAPDGTGEAWPLSLIRYRRDMTEGLRVAALENVRNARSILSSWQTLVNLTRAEAEFVRTGPEVAA